MTSCPLFPQQMKSTASEISKSAHRQQRDHSSRSSKRCRVRSEENGSACGPRASVFGTGVPGATPQPAARAPLVRALALLTRPSRALHTHLNLLLRQHWRNNEVKSGAPGMPATRTTLV